MLQKCHWIGAGKSERIGGDYFSNYSDDSPTTYVFITIVI